MTPIELQLQWRVAYDKDAVGIEALRRHRVRGPSSRLVSLVADREVRVGGIVTINGDAVGHVVNAGWSATRGDCVALALLDLRVAHPGIAAFLIAQDGGRVPARSVSPPCSTTEASS